MTTPSVIPTILLCAGGTGGHMFPARALAEELLGRGYKVALACDTRGRKYFDGMEHSVDIHVLASGTYKAGLMGKIAFILPLLKGFFQSRDLVKRLQPVAAVGFGGYPSAPPVFAAQLAGIPTILHEQNAILGLANKLLAGRAACLALSWAQTTGIKPDWAGKQVVTGNPVRADIAALRTQPYPMIGSQTTVMVVGGSQGAAVFSDVVPQAFANLPAALKEQVQIIQQSRPDKLEAVKAFYAEHGLKAEVQPFYTDMPARLAKTHLLITRSGASTIAELTAAGRPAIYVPYPWNRDDQQTFNARTVVDQQGGVLIQEKDLTVDALQNLLTTWLSDPDGLAAAAAKAKALGQPDAAKLLADAVLAQLRRI